LCSIKGEVTCRQVCVKFMYTHINTTTALTWRTVSLHNTIQCTCTL
jgi:hypothetical protein